MNHRFTIAQPCVYRYRGEEDPQVRPNTQRDFVLLEELEGIYEEVIMFHKLKKPIGFFTEVWKAVYDVESYKDYGYYLVARNVGIRDIFDAIKRWHVWPGRIMAFGDNPPTDSNNLVTYDDNYVIVGLDSPKNARLYKRRDR
jgi:hypothetical protein